MGGQAYPNWDFDLAPYVRRSYEKQKKDLFGLIPSESFKSYKKYRKHVKTLAWERTEKETFQAMEAFVHNCNSMLCRNGQQVPFISINFGLDTSPEGRMVTRATLKAQEKGLGDGTTPIFPILIYKCMKGINTEKGDPNYDLFEQAIRTTSKRLFPRH